MKKALIAMSGGVDSSVAAVLMQELGYECAGLTLLLFNNEAVGFQAAGLPQGIIDAKAAAALLGIPHHVLDFTENFEKQVMQSFIRAYEQALTPNPCVVCNKHIKFNLAALKEGLQGKADFDCFATGHYARTEYDSASGRYLLRKAADEKKDQSYVLYSLDQSRLERIRFPLGALTKQEVRNLAKGKNLANAAKAESQDICFVPDGDYCSFIERRSGKSYPPGDILDLEGRPIGRHRGIIRYTIGQRRGLGVAANTPIYVAAKSAQANSVTLGPDSSLYSKALVAGDINLIACSKIERPMRVMVKTRYLQTAQAATAEQTGDDSLHIEFDAPQRAITPGQAAVMYDGDIVIGGGTIAG
ncbi:MAG: tRNA 2-thiouridine(34) synthase MnmA [Spirochaetes bacterium]|nr:tRNA 2-thiouridine(34) synthase MnmA [Spirochaetota bacterium]